MKQNKQMLKASSSPMLPTVSYLASGRARREADRSWPGTEQREGKGPWEEFRSSSIWEFNELHLGIHLAGRGGRYHMCFSNLAASGQNGDLNMQSPGEVLILNLFLEIKLTLDKSLFLSTPSFFSLSKCRTFYATCSEQSPREGVWIEWTGSWENSAENVFYFKVPCQCDAWVQRLDIVFISDGLKSLWPNHVTSFPPPLWDPVPTHELGLWAFPVSLQPEWLSFLAWCSNWGKLTAALMKLEPGARCLKYIL